MPSSSQDESPETGHPIYKRPRRRAWHRRFFYDHPGYEHGDPDAFAGLGRTHDKVKVWCKRCFAQRLEYELARDAPAEREQSDEPATINFLWSLQPPDAGWISGRPANCLVHLRDCELQDSHIRQEAGAQHRSPARRRSQRQGSVSSGGRVSPPVDRRRTPAPGIIPSHEAAEPGPSRLIPYDDPRPSLSPLPPLASLVPLPHAYHASEHGQYSGVHPQFQDWERDQDGAVSFSEPATYTAAAAPEPIEYPAWAAPVQMLEEPVLSGNVFGVESQHDHEGTWDVMPYHAGLDASTSMSLHPADNPIPVWPDNSGLYSMWQDAPSNAAQEALGA